MSHRTGFVENLAAAGTKNAVERVVRLANPKVAEQWPSVSLHGALIVDDEFLIALDLKFDASVGLQRLHCGIKRKRRD